MEKYSRRNHEATTHSFIVIQHPGPRHSPPDKLGHIKAGLAMGIVLSIPLDGKWHRVRARNIGCAVGAGKEIRDSRGFGNPEIGDFLATCAGAWIGSELMEYLFR